MPDDVSNGVGFSCSGGTLDNHLAVPTKQRRDIDLLSRSRLSQEEVKLDDSWFAQNSRDLRRFQEFRHAVPALINEENSRLGRVKIGTDMAVSDSHLLEMMRFYKRELAERTT